MSELQQEFNLDRGPEAAPSVGAPKVPQISESPKILSVSNLNQAIKGMLEGEFPIVWLKGEISNFKPHTSGHFYFNLKDAKSQINAVMFRGFNTHIKFKPQDGMEVIVRGRVTVYEPRGNYQLFCEVMEPVGQGALQMAFEQLKKKLHAEGLFNAARKRPLPAMPKHVALVTSITGAAIRDMLNVLSRRFKGLEITILPTSVQGANAPREIVAAIQLANRLGHFDVMIVGRGGGSIEDLWGFNDEGVARAIFNSKIPVVSAVGHEIDFTIADFVADLRAPTPSAAAELIVKNAADITGLVRERARQIKLSLQKRLHLARVQTQGLQKQLIDPKRKLIDLALRSDDLETRLRLAIERTINDQRNHIQYLKSRLGTPGARVKLARENLRGLEARLSHTTFRASDARRARLKELTSVLDSISPLKVVERGYSIVTKSNGTKQAGVVKDASQLKLKDQVEIRFAHGTVRAEITEIQQERI